MTAVFFVTKYFAAERLELFSVAACVLIPFLTAVVCYRNVLHHPLGRLISVDREFKMSIKNYIPLIYSAEDSASFAKYMDLSWGQKQKIDLDICLGIRNPDSEIFEEYKKIINNIDYINAFFTDEHSILSKIIAFRPDGSPALLCISHEFALALNWDEYLAAPENPLLRIFRRPLHLEKI